MDKKHLNTAKTWFNKDRRLYPAASAHLDWAALLLRIKRLSSDDTTFLTDMLYMRVKYNMSTRKRFREIADAYLGSSGIYNRINTEPIFTKALAMRLKKSNPNDFMSIKAGAAEVNYRQQGVLA